MPTDLDPIAVLRRTDPASGAPVPERPPLDELAALPDVVPSGRPRTARALALAAALVLVVLLAGAAIAVTRPESDAPPAATTTTLIPPAPTGDTPPRPLPLVGREPAAAALLALAGAAEADPTVVPAVDVAYARTVARNQQISVSGSTTSITYVASQRETWTEPDGTAHWRSGPGPAPRDGSIIQVDPDLDLPEGEVVDWFDPTSTPLARPQGADAVLADLRVGQGGAPEPYAVLERLSEILRRQPLTAADRAALYRALATVDGIEHRGEVTDRAGRQGIAFSYESDFGGALSELIVVVDGSTGALLQVERVMLESAPAIPIDEPVVQSYEVVLAVTSVAEVGDRPS